MQKARIYILQFLGVIILLCSYLLGNQPDSKSVMHFNSDPLHTVVFTKAIKYTANDGSSQTSVTADHHNKHKSKVSRHISYDVMLPAHKSGYVFCPLNNVQHSCSLRDQYEYLFYAEINPPPPKAC